MKTVSDLSTSVSALSKVHSFTSNSGSVKKERRREKLNGVCGSQDALLDIKITS